jgi:hypothetical protein
MIPQSSVVNSFKLDFSNSNRWTLFVIAISSSVYFLAFDFLRWNQYDSASYEAGARLLFGLEGGADLQGRMSKPLALLFPGLCEFALGIDARYGFLIQSGICYVLLVFLWKGILKNLEFSEEMQKMGILMLVMSQPFAVFSFGILADFPGWCCMLWLIYIYTQRSLSFKWLWVAAVTFIGLLVKESIFVGIVFVVISEFFNTSTRKISALRYVLLFGVIFVITQILIYYLNFDGLVNRQREIRNWGGVFEIQNTSQILQIWRAFEGIWWFFLTPIVFHQKKLFSDSLFSKTTLSLIFCVSLMPFVHPAFLVDRVLFMFFPLVFLSLLTLLNQPYVSKRGWFIVLSGSLSVVYTWLTYKFSLSGLFPYYFATSLIIPLIIILSKRKKNEIG